MKVTALHARVNWLSVMGGCFQVAIIAASWAS
jgi:hypothetical protein